MPSGPSELHAKWKDDGKAIAYLESRGFKLTENFEWEQPAGHTYTEEDDSALAYLIYEWDYGGIINHGG